MKQIMSLLVGCGLAVAGCACAAERPAEAAVARVTVQVFSGDVLRQTYGLRVREGQEAFMASTTERSFPGTSLGSVKTGVSGSVVVSPSVVSDAKEVAVAMELVDLVDQPGVRVDEMRVPETVTNKFSSTVIVRRGEKVELPASHGSKKRVLVSIE